MISSGLTRLLGTKNAADLNLLLTNELCLNGATLNSCNNALEQFVEFLKSKLKEGHEKFKEILVVSTVVNRTTCLPQLNFTLKILLHK